MMPEYDAVVVGAGPNGLSAAIELARNGCSVLVVEARDTVGGGVRSEELTLPGFVHDVCSTSYPLVVASPAMNEYRLDKFGLEWVNSPALMAHPLDDGTAPTLERSINATAEQFGEDADAYRRMMRPLTDAADKLSSVLLSPILRGPLHPILMARFAYYGLRSSVGLSKSQFRGDRARALFSGIAAHSVLPLHKLPSAAYSLVLGLYGHARGWPMVRGGAQQLSNAMAACLEHHGGEIRTGWNVKTIDELPSSRVVLFDLSPRLIVKLAGHRLPDGYRRRLNKYRYGPGAFKIDWALDAPVPWTAERTHRAGVIHVCGDWREIEFAEKEVSRGRHPERPFILAAQQSLFDDSRAPDGKHVLWAYTHVPNGSPVDMTERIEAQIERFAPGFRERVLARTVRFPNELEDYNPSMIGGDITGGMQSIWQLIARPVLRWSPYRTPTKGLYICSASTPPGGGVHGMSGYHAARAALRDL
jgi:phytoene dehydrogenase-like protein